MHKKTNTRHYTVTTKGEENFRLAYDDHGDVNDPSPLFCVPGLGCSRRYFDYFAQSMLKKGRRVITVDLPGHGQSDWFDDKRRYSIPRFADACGKLIKGLDLTHVDWVGTSLGGIVGMYAIATYEVQARHLVLNDIGPEVPALAAKFIETCVGLNWAFPDERTFAGAYSLFISLLGVGPLTLQQKRQRALTECRVDDKGKFRLHYDQDVARYILKPEQTGGLTDLWGHYNQITCPTLVLRGSRSTVLTPAVVNRMQEEGPKAQVVEVGRFVGHFPSLEDNRQLEVVERFLAGKLRKLERILYTTARKRQRLILPKLGRRPPTP